MKNAILLAMVLVFGLASLASAIPIIEGPNTIPIDGTITLTVSGYTETGINPPGESLPGSQGFVWVDYSAYSYQISNVGSPLNAMGSNASIDTSYVTVGGGVRFTADPGVPWSEETDVDVGPWFTFDLSALAGASVGNTYGVEILDSTFNNLSTYVVTVVPEPMTLSLLALGGLALVIRRRA